MTEIGERREERGERREERGERRNVGIPLRRDVAVLHVGMPASPQAGENVGINSVCNSCKIAIFITFNLNLKNNSSSNAINSPSLQRQEWRGGQGVRWGSRKVAKL
ncbi:MAG TPA: hypothetical protein PLT99_13945, partial [Chitinophagales bacterium]|nr:hypothetical protein [Chitinophagales bacterium]